MKTNVTYVDAAKFEAIMLEKAKQHGFQLADQKGFIRVEGPKGRRIYVASTKRVGRVDLSGVEVRTEDGKHALGFVAPHCGPFGNVKQQLDMSLGEEAILANFSALLDLMAALPPVEKAQRKPAAPKADAPVGWTKIDPKARAAKIKEAAEKRAKKAGEEAPVAQG
jgi:hypothetical protein